MEASLARLGRDHGLASVYLTGLAVSTAASLLRGLAPNIAVFVAARAVQGPVRCELTAPDGDTWRFGDSDAPSVIIGLASESCRVGARRLRPKQTSLEASVAAWVTALRVLRNYAA